MYLQSVEEARPVKASEVGEQMEAQETEVDFLENEKTVQNNHIHFYLKGGKRETTEDEGQLWTPLDTHTTL